MVEENGDAPRAVINVIIVEDHEFTRMGLKLSLDALPGIKVIGEAEAGQEGIEKARALKPDVVLMDIQLPDLDGIEATKQIRAENPDMRVIMLTSHSSDQAIFAALGAGANAYCLKNITAQQLSVVIKMVADGGAWLDPGIANRVLSAYSTTQGLPAPAEKPAAKATKRDSHTLSPRETEVLRLVAEGFSNQRIAEKLGLGLETVKTHMRHIMEKLTVSDRTEAAVKAMKQGLV
jgi:two-component system, NarL family, response regulator LiaR